MKRAKRKSQEAGEDDPADFIASDESESEHEPLEKNNMAYYEFLGVAPKATVDEIKKAYHKKALQVHPDKNADNVEAAKAQFQKLAHIYGVLSDETKRRYYDQFGESSTEMLEGMEDARQIFEAVMEYINSIHRVTKDDIKDFFAEMAKLRKNGQVSDEEDAELRSLFEKFDGNLKKILAHCNTHTAGYESKLDSSRFTAHLAKIAEGKGVPLAAEPAKKAGARGSRKTAKK